MTYTVVKALHITSVVLWMGAMLVAPLASGAGGVAMTFAARLRWLMSAGLIATWLSGLTLASLAGWFRADWLQAKLLIVVALSGAHGMIVGRLRRATGEQVPAGARAWGVTLGLAAAVLAIALLVLIKPEF